MDDEIIKEKIICYVVLKNNTYNGERRFFSVEPIKMDWEGLDSATEPFDNRNEEVVGVVPANNDFVVGAFIEGKYRMLGYECENSYHPDWNNEIAETKEMLEKKRKNLSNR